MLNPDQLRTRELAFSLAVQHYGMANHAPTAVPARPEVVARTMTEWERLLSGESFEEVYPNSQPAPPRTSPGNRSGRR